MANVTIETGTLAEEYTGDDATLHMRAYVTATFVAANGETVMRSNFEQGLFYKTVVCPVIAGIVTYPAFTLPSNVDATDDPDRSKYILVLFTPAGRMVQAVAKRLRIPPTPNPTTLALIDAYSHAGSEPPSTDPDHYTNDEIDQLIAGLVSTAELTTAINAAVTALIAGAPGALDTLDELAAALGDNANFAALVVQALVPVGGATGQVLAKSSNANYALAWSTLSTAGWMPVGGTAGQILRKINGTNYNVEWADPEAVVGLLPTGGTAGQLLSKVDADDYDAVWIDPPSSVVYDPTITHATASMADAASVSETMAGVGKTVILAKVQVSRECRLRIYGSAAARDADAARLVGVAPDFTTEHLLVLEYIFETGGLTKWLNLSPIFVNAESPRTTGMPIHVTNNSGATGTVVITIGGLIVEA